MYYIWMLIKRLFTCCCPTGYIKKYEDFEQELSLKQMEEISHKDFQPRP